MPRDGAIIFRDLVGKLAVLRIECDKCGRSGRYADGRGGGTVAGLVSASDRYAGAIPVRYLQGDRSEMPWPTVLFLQLLQCLDLSNVKAAYEPRPYASRQPRFDLGG
jgi:hypothetical protein